MSSKPTKFTFDASTRAITKFFNIDTADIHFVFPPENNFGNIPNFHVVAHKTLLSLLSPVFAAMFSGNSKESSRVEISDSSIVAFATFIQYFYASCVEVDEENVGEILYLANKYDIPDLVSSCSSFLLEHVTLDNVVDFLSLAQSFDFHELKAKCQGIIGSDTPNVLESPAFLQCNKDVLFEILSMESSSCAEEEIFDACIKWAKTKCEEQELESNGENMRIALGTGFDRIRFKEMNQNGLYERLRQHDDMFTKKEIVDIVTLPGKNGFTVIPRYHKPSNYVFEFTEGDQQSIDQHTLIKLTRRMELTAFRLPKFVDETVYGMIDDNFTNTVLVKLFPGNSNPTSHRFNRAKILDNDETYCFYLLTPAVLLPGIFYSVQLNASESLVWPVTFIVSNKHVNGETLTPYKANYPCHNYKQRDFTTCFAALFFQECAGNV